MPAAGFWIIIAVAVAAVLGEWTVRRRFPLEVLEKVERPAGELFMAAGAGLYGVLVAFVLSAALSNFDRVREAGASEADSIANLASVAAGLPAPAEQEIRAAIANYARALLEEERTKGSGAGSDASTALRTLRSLIVGFKPKGEGETNLHAAALDLVNRASDQRRARLAAGAHGCPTWSGPCCCSAAFTP